MPVRLLVTRINSIEPLATLPHSCRVPRDRLDLTFRHRFVPHAFDVSLHCSAAQAFCIWPEDNQHFHREAEEKYLNRKHMMEM